jgi:hypothetical protein
VAKTATCLACSSDAPIEHGTAGLSAAAEGDRRARRRTEAARKRYGDHAAVVAEAMATQEAAASWGKGSEGEAKLAAFIEREVGERVIALHDRRIPGTRGNIDHVFVAPTGVWVVDAKAYRGKVVKRDLGPPWRREHEVLVGGRNRTRLAKGVEHQVAAVKVAVRADEALKDVAVFGVLCFVSSEWGLLDFPFSIRTTWVAYPGALRKQLRKDGPLSRETMERIARRLDLSLPPA